MTACILILILFAVGMVLYFMTKKEKYVVTNAGGFPQLGDIYSNPLECEKSSQCLRGPESPNVCITSAGISGVCVQNSYCCPSFMAGDRPVVACPFPSSRMGCSRWCKCIGNHTQDCIEGCGKNFHPYPYLLQGDTFP